MGKIHGRSSDNRSYEILTENGLIVSRNRIHLWETNVVFRECVPISICIADPIDGACKAESVMAPKPSPVSQSPPTTSPSIKTIRSTVGSNDDLYRTWSGRIVRKPSRYCE